MSKPEIEMAVIDQAIGAIDDQRVPGIVDDTENANLLRNLENPDHVNSCGLMFMVSSLFSLGGFIAGIVQLTSDGKAIPPEFYPFMQTTPICLANLVEVLQQNLRTMLRLCMVGGDGGGRDQGIMGLGRGIAHTRTGKRIERHKNPPRYIVTLRHFRAEERIKMGQIEYLMAEYLVVVNY
ncbi:hypothetical protein COLO4_25577 [Corchorus olitorius]|uniref:Uncharacterized protein n=1 Tax=Corchorus olitorius TaxID=93759 RepID=A0A1R3I1E8_9ROSI|nr:hypothetical protein COLO4_25577 [Corchorus olitorius]